MFTEYIYMLQKYETNIGGHYISVYVFPLS